MKTRLREILNLVSSHIKEHREGLTMVKINIQMNPETLDISAWTDSYGQEDSKKQVVWTDHGTTEYRTEVAPSFFNKVHGKL